MHLWFIILSIFSYFSESDAEHSAEFSSEENDDDEDSETEETKIVVDTKKPNEISSDSSNVESPGSDSVV